jgi:hypothetical protein
MENRIKQDGIRSWYQRVYQYETDSNLNVRIKKLDNVEELVRDKSFVETCNFPRSHAIRHEQQNKEKVTRQVNSTCQTTKKDKVNRS